VFVFDEYLSAL